MIQPSKLVNVLTGLLLSITCAACGRAALTPPMRQDSEPRPFVLDAMNRVSQHGTSGPALDDLAGARALRRLTDDAGLQDARATRSGWAASDAR